jgi:hypothetical protein
MTRSGTYGTKQNKVEDCHQCHVHHQGATGVSKHIDAQATNFFKKITTIF